MALRFRSMFHAAPVALFGVLIAPPAVAAETCHHMQTEVVRDQYHCVSSVLASQAGNDYGPKNLAGLGGDGAWCEGASGNGAGESIVIRFSEKMRFRQIYLTNGYVKTPQTFANNGRVKVLTAQTSDGVSMRINAKDTSEPQVFRLPKRANANSIKFTIAEVYPGARSPDTCLSELLLNLEEFNR